MVIFLLLQAEIMEMYDNFTLIAKKVISILNGGCEGLDILKADINEMEPN